MAWTDKQLNQLRRYRRWAKIQDNEYRNRLATLSSCGARSSLHPELDQRDYDIFMACLEGVLEHNFQEGVVAKLPDGIQIRYWRDRLPKAGMPDERMIYRVYDLWNSLKVYLPADCRDTAYLYQIAFNAVKHQVVHINKLTAREVIKVIEALRDKLNWEEKRAAKEAGIAATHTHTVADSADHDLYTDQECVPEPAVTSENTPPPPTDDVPF